MSKLVRLGSNTEGVTGRQEANQQIKCGQVSEVRERSVRHKPLSKSREREDRWHRALTLGLTNMIQKQTLIPTGCVNSINSNY